MKLLTQADIDTIKKEAAAIPTPKSKLQDTVKELKKELKVARELHKEEIEELGRQTRQTNAKNQEKFDAEIHNLEVVNLKLNNRIEKLIVKVEELEELKKDDATNLKKTYSIELREKVVEAKEKNFEDLAGQLAKADEKAEKTREEGYKSGYADGIADGLREATKITSEDRKMAMQIAAIAASSHTPDAATEIAKNVLKDVTNALPAGKKES